MRLLRVWKKIWARRGGPRREYTTASLPSQVAERLALYQRLKVAADERQAEQALREKRPILVSLPDGRSIQCESWTITPYQLALQISQNLAKAVVTARVNGSLYDLDRPLEGDATVEFVGFDSQAGQELFWHSSAHLLGEAAERFYGALLCHGPSTDQGFFYDLYLDEERTEWEQLDSKANQAQQSSGPRPRKNRRSPHASPLYIPSGVPKPAISSQLGRGSLLRLPGHWSL